MAEDDVREGGLKDVTSELRPRLTKGMKRRGRAAGSVLSIGNSTSKGPKLEKAENAGGVHMLQCNSNSKMCVGWRGKKRGAEADPSKPAWGSLFYMKNAANICFLAINQTFIPKR